MVLLVFLYAVFAGTFSLGKHILAYTQPIFVIGLRMTIAGAIILAYQHFFAKKTVQLRSDHFLKYVKVMFFTVLVPYLLRAWGLGYMSSCKASFLYNTGPFISYLLSCLLYAERVRTRKLLGLVVGFIGLLPVVFASGTGFGAGCSQWSYLPDIAMMLSVSSISFGWLIAHDMIKRFGYCPMLINGMSMFGGGLLALLISLATEDRSQYIIEPQTFWIILAVIIIMSNLICHNLYAHLLRRYTPTMMSFASFMTPFFAGIYGRVFLGEAITWNFCCANAIVAIGLALFYSEELRHLRQEREAIIPAHKSDTDLALQEEAARNIDGELPGCNEPTDAL